MKRIALHMGIAATLVVSCTVKEEDFVTPHQDDVIFYASFEQPSKETRVYANEDLYLRWTADDRVSIFNKLTYNQQYKFTGNTGANAGGFKKVDSDEFVTGNTISHVVSVYPYQEATEISESEVLTLTLPAEQHYAENTFGLGANTMVSVSSDNVLQYKNVGGYLRISLYGEGVTVSSITLKGNNGEKLAGKASITMPLNGEPSAVLTNEASDKITLVCDTPVALGASADESMDFWFVVPPVTFSKGFSVSVTRSSGDVFVKTTSKSITLERSDLSKMSPIEVEAGIVQPKNIIEYTSYIESIIEPNVSYGFGANIIDNSYSNGKGIISFDADVTAIPSNAFQGSQYLESITLPSSTKSIGNNAFKQCELLVSINLSNNLETIGADAFSGCTNLSSIILPNSLKSIGKHSFGDCRSLKEITLPSKITSIPEQAFTWCDKMEHITIPNSVTSIGSTAFWACQSLQSITLPTELVSLGSSVFYACNKIERIVIPASVTAIGDFCFEECSNLSSIIFLGESINSLGKGILRYCNQLESIEGKYSTEDKRCLIRNNQLLGFAPKGVASYSFPSSITSIGEYSVAGYSDLTIVTIPDTVTLIEQFAFGWGNLTTVYIGKGIKAINNSAFIYNSKLENLYCKAVNPPILGSSAINRHTSNFSIFVPLESVDLYKTAQYWSDYADRIQAIPDFFFNGKPLSKEDENVYSGIVSLQKNESLKLDGDIQLTSFWSDPDFVVNGCFNAVNGLYKVTLNKGDFTITFRRVNADGSAPNLSEGGLYLQGWGVAEKKMSEFIGWPGTGGYQLAQVSDGVYQFTGKAVNENATEIGGRFRRDYVKFGYFFQDGWGNEASAGVTISGNAASLFEQESDKKFHNLVEQNASLDLGSTYRLIIDFTNTTISGNAITSGIETVRIDKL